MTQIDNVKLFMKEKGLFTIPELQLRFDISYFTVRKLISEMLKNGTAEAVGEGYRFIPPPADNPSEYWLFLTEAERIERVKQRLDNCEYLSEHNGKPDEPDELACKALWACLQSGSASASLIQRKLGIPYARADKIISWMEKMEYVSKAFGPMSRKLLVCKDEYIFTYGNSENPVLKPEFTKPPQPPASDEKYKFVSDEDCEEIDLKMREMRDLIRQAEEEGWDEYEDAEDGDDEDDDEYEDEISKLFDFDLSSEDDEDEEAEENEPPTVDEEYARFRKRLDEMRKAGEPRIDNRYSDEITDRFRPHRDNTEKIESVGRLTSILRFVRGKKQRPVTAETEPPHNLWPTEREFADAVMERLKKLIRTDRKMARGGAIKKAELYLEAVRDTHDGKMLQLYERLVYELKACSDYLYNQLRRQVWED